MTTQASNRVPRRAPLSRERVLDAAMKLADQGGLESLSMRKLGQELGAEAMAVYYYFANKDEVIDGMVDIVFSEIELPNDRAGWKAAMRERAMSLRDVLLRHRWAIGLMEARRNAGPANLRHHDAVLGSLRAADFGMDLAAHAYSLLDSYVYGFALTKMNLPIQATEEVAEVAQGMLQRFPVDEYPNLVAIIAERMKPGYDYGDEFEYGLDLILDGLQKASSTA